jgi:hypothetical protein
MKCPLLRQQWSQLMNQSAVLSRHRCPNISLPNPFPSQHNSISDSIGIYWEKEGGIELMSNNIIIIPGKCTLAHLPGHGVLMQGGRKCG